MATVNVSTDADFYTKTAILLKKTEYDGELGAPGCWIGGLPTLPKRFDWPWRIVDGKAIHPLHFIAQINLSELPPSVATDLPIIGTLFFFANYVSDVEGQSTVIYAEEDVSDQLERPVPDFPNGFEELGVQAHWVGNKVDAFKKWPVVFYEYSELSPSKDSGSDQFSPLYDKQIQELQKALAAPSKRSRLWDWILGVDYGHRRSKLSFHRLLGAEPLPQPPAINTDEIFRLLTIEHDEDVGFLFSSQELAFFINKLDLLERRFDKSYALQC